MGGGYNFLNKTASLRKRHLYGASDSCQMLPDVSSSFVLRAVGLLSPFNRGKFCSESRGWEEPGEGWAVSLPPSLTPLLAFIFLFWNERGCFAPQHMARRPRSRTFGNWRNQEWKGWSHRDHPDITAVACLGVSATLLHHKGFLYIVSLRNRPFWVCAKCGVQSKRTGILSAATRSVRPSRAPSASGKRPKPDLMVSFFCQACLEATSCHVAASPLGLPTLCWCTHMGQPQNRVGPIQRLT